MQAMPFLCSSSSGLVISLLLLLSSLLPLTQGGWIAPSRGGGRVIASSKQQRQEQQRQHQSWRASLFSLPFSASGNDDDVDNDEISPGSIDDSPAAAEPLTLSANDLERLSQLRNRHRTIPIVILDAMLPGQAIEFGVKDRRFRVLADYLQSSGDLLGMIGFDPATGLPLNCGVTAKIERLLIESDMVTVALQGQDRFEVEREPWLDETESYYMADVEIVENRLEPDLSPEQQEEAESLNREIPGLVEEWLQWLYKTGKATPESMTSRKPFLKEMPEAIGDRAVWTAGLLNPLPALGVCLEIRPSMLVCRTDLERVRLAHASLKASIDHLSGKRKLF